MKLLGKVIDERFLAHRRQSTSIAGMATAALAIVLFEWRLLANHVLRWDLLSVALAFVAVKLGLMIFYYFTD